MRSEHALVGEENGRRLLDVSQLGVRLRTSSGVVDVVEDVSFGVSEGETLAIVGESGSGKSVTARSMLRLLPRALVESLGGTVNFLGRDLLALSDREMSTVRGKEIGVIFQDPMSALNPVVTIGRQVAEPLQRHLGLSYREAMERVVALLDEVKIPDSSSQLEAFPHQFSGGMRQRVLIAAATACRPRLLIADEPTTALDVTVQAEILELLKQLQTLHGMGIIFISHDLHLVSAIADRVAVMYAGELVEYASVESLFESPEHPYTEGLLGALPDMSRRHEDVRREELIAIPGSPPDPREFRDACRFAPRCAYSSLADTCRSERPALREVRAGHWVRSCHPKSERGGGGFVGEQ